MADMDEAVLKRVLPHSIEAEQSVIGAMLMDREAITIASEQINGEDFYGKQYGILFDTMVELNDEGKPVDLITLQDRLKEKAVPPEIYSLEYIRDIMDTVPTQTLILILMIKSCCKFHTIRTHLLYVYPYRFTVHAT